MTEKKWMLPEHLAPYDQYTDHPGRAEELINHPATMFNNHVVALMRAATDAQYRLLARLSNAGLLVQELATSLGKCGSCGQPFDNGCPDCGACKAGCHGGFESNPCTHLNAKWSTS